MNLKGKSLLTLNDYSKEEIIYLLEVAKKLKNDKKLGCENQYLKGKNIALIFEKDSTRTRCSFEVAAYDQGAHTTYLGPTGSQVGKKESIKDTARVLAGMYDGIEFRGYSQKAVEELSIYSKLPVWNGLTDDDHPTQILADFLTILETSNKKLEEVTLSYLGDGRNNMARALMIGASKVGMTFKVISPKELIPDESFVNMCKVNAEASGGKIIISDDINDVKDSDYIYTDVWVSMGEDKSVWEQRINILEKYKVNMELLKKTGNDKVKFMHCLPAFHDLNTEVSKEIYNKFGIKDMEVTDEVFESDASVVFQEAENRMHTIKAIMVSTLYGDILG